MADFVFNAAKGKVAEWVYRVNNNDPANSALIVVPLSTSGTQAQGEDQTSLAGVLGTGFFVELSGNGWERKTITDTEITNDPNLNVTSNEMESTFDDVTWLSVTAGTSSGVLICYDSDTTSGDNTNIVPISHHDFVATGVGGNIGLTVPGTGFVRSQ